MTEPSPDYKGRGEAGILSGVPASPSNHREAWLGFHGTDFSILIDLGKTLRIDSIVIGTLTNIALGIMPPLEVQVSAGSAPDSLRPFGTLESIEKASAQTASPVRNQHRIRARGVSARFLQIDVRCTKTLPTWHPAAGQRAWLFIDNILVNPSGTR
jgi:hexosaminidase